VIQFDQNCKNSTKETYLHEFKVVVTLAVPAR